MAAISVEAYNVWFERPKYDEAECRFYEGVKKVCAVPSSQAISNTSPSPHYPPSLTPLADEVAKARQRLIEVKGSIGEGLACGRSFVSQGSNSELENLQKSLKNVMIKLEKLEDRVAGLESKCSAVTRYIFEVTVTDPKTSLAEVEKKIKALVIPGVVYIQVSEQREEPAKKLELDVFVKSDQQNLTPAVDKVKAALKNIGSLQFKNATSLF